MAVENKDHVVICSAVRTPVGSFNGSLATVPASRLGEIVIKEALSRAKVEAGDVDEVVMGQVFTANCGQNPARLAAVKAGCSDSVSAYGLNMLCGSGLKSIAVAAQSIQVGDSKVAVAGGQESMSLAPHVINMRSGLKMGDGALTDCMIKDGLTCAMNNIHMGITAENIAKKYSITREEQDIFAANSQNKAEKAQTEGCFKNEIVPVSIPSRKETITVAEDEYIRKGATVEGMQKLRPCFIRDATGTVTPGNASGINDGAAACVLMAESEAKKREITPMAKIISWAQAGVDPTIMGTGPIPATEKALAKAGWTMDEVDLFEFNEAFAAQALAVTKELGADQNKVNVNGGAIAIGHPLGCSGTRVLVTLLHAMEARGSSKGVAALCIGGGMGIAMCVEKC